LILKIINCFLTTIVPTLPHNYSLDEVRWKKTFPVLGNEQITITGLPVAGGSSDDSLPSFTSAVVSIHTALGGRSHRGRVYLAGVSETQAVGSLIDVEGPYWAALLNFILCIAAAFITSEGSGGSHFVLGVYSRKLGGATFPYGAVGFTPATALTPHRELGTTRSRKVGRGS
jgi:hypothetical protein